MGWCQFGAPEEVPKIKNRAAHEKSLTTWPDWRIACNLVGKGTGARASLAGALDLIAGLGGGKVEGYPKPRVQFLGCHQSRRADVVGDLTTLGGSR